MNRNPVYDDILDSMEYHIEQNMGGGVITNKKMEGINMMLFNHLAKGTSNRDRQLVFNRTVRSRNRNEKDKLFMLRLRVDVDERLRSRRPHVDRSRIGERETSDLRDIMETYTMDISEMDNVRDITEAYVETYMSIEDGIGDMFDELAADGKMRDPEYLDVFASGEIFYEFGGFRIFPMVGSDMRWIVMYETTPLISTGIKNDFGW